jgi:hypothetical protein
MYITMINDGIKYNIMQFSLYLPIFMIHTILNIHLNASE